MATLSFKPRLPSEKQLASRLSKLPWVKAAKHIKYVDSGDANQDIPVSYIDVTLDNGKVCTIRSSLTGGYTVEGVPWGYRGRMKTFFESQGLKNVISRT